MTKKLKMKCEDEDYWSFLPVTIEGLKVSRPFACEEDEYWEAFLGVDEPEESDE